MIRKGACQFDKTNRIRALIETYILCSEQFRHFFGRKVKALSCIALAAHHQYISIDSSHIIRVKIGEIQISNAFSIIYR